VPGISSKIVKGFKMVAEDEYKEEWVSVIKVAMVLRGLSR
jgi:hypothetical protein